MIFRVVSQKLEVRTFLSENNNIYWLKKGTKPSGRKFELCHKWFCESDYNDQSNIPFPHSEQLKGVKPLTECPFFLCSQANKTQIKHPKENVEDPRTTISSR